MLMEYHFPSVEAVSEGLSRFRGMNGTCLGRVTFPSYVCQVKLDSLEEEDHQNLVKTHMYSAVAGIES